MPVDFLATELKGDMHDSKVLRVPNSAGAQARDAKEAQGEPLDRVRLIYEILARRTERHGRSIDLFDDSDSILTGALDS